MSGEEGRIQSEYIALPGEYARSRSLATPHMGTGSQSSGVNIFTAVLLTSQTIFLGEGTAWGF